MKAHGAVACTVACVLHVLSAPALGGEPASEPKPPTDVSNIILQNDGGLIAELSTDKKIAALKTRFSKDEDRYLWLLNVSGPFDEEESQALVGDLDNLGASAAIEAGYQFVDGKNRQRTTISAKVGRKSFKYIDSADVSKDVSQEEAAYDVSITWSKFFSGPGPFQRGALFGARARFQESHEGEPDFQVCVPYADSPGATRCRSTGSAPPKRNRSPILQAQLATVPWEYVGLSVLVSRDFELNVTGIETPVYLVRNSDTGLFNGGIKLSWRSDEDEVKAILFIGVPLGTF